MKEPLITKYRIVEQDGMFHPQFLSEENKREPLMRIQMMGPFSLGEEDIVCSIKKKAEEIIRLAKEQSPNVVGEY